MMSETVITVIDEGEYFNFRYGGVTWKIAPLPFNIKKDLHARSAMAISNREKIGDMVDIQLDAIKYGLKGWDGLKYSSGKEVPCILVKDKKGYDCLDQKCIEMIYKTSVFQKLSDYCINPSEIPDYMKESVELGEDNSQKGPEPLEDLDKKK